MKRTLLIIAIIFLISACSGGGAKELFETAQFEELQNNHKHAVQIYEEIVSKYPDTDFAVKAKQRLEDLNREQRGK